MTWKKIQYVLFKFFVHTEPEIFHTRKLVEKFYLNKKMGKLVHLLSANVTWYWVQMHPISLTQITDLWLVVFETCQEAQIRVSQFDDSF